MLKFRAGSDGPGGAAAGRLLPVGVVGVLPKVPNRTALGPTTGDKAHSPFGAYYEA